jgi:hypothetical protein
MGRDEQVMSRDHLHKESNGDVTFGQLCPPVTEITSGQNVEYRKTHKISQVVGDRRVQLEDTKVPS